MKIYMKDGKALSYKKQFFTPKQAGETWVLNSAIEYIDDSGVTFNADFTSNGFAFSSISLSANPRRQIQYDSTVVKAIYGWTSEAYRKLTFAATPTGDLLTWLNENGVKQ